MKADKFFIPIISIIFSTVLLSGCDNKPPVASPECVGIERTNDPEKNKELLKKCPRAGQPFKPSDEKKW